MSMTCATVMIVDDFADTRELISMLLKMKGCRVLEAANGQEAVEIANREHPDLILMDLQMPVLNGFEATRQIHASEKTRQVPVVAMSAHCEGNWREQALAAGARECLGKPVDFVALDRVLGRYVH